MTEKSEDLMTMVLTTDLPRCANGSYSIVTSRYLNSSDNIDLQRETDEMMMPREP